VAYVRVGYVEAGLAKEFADAVQRLGATNNVKGVVVDLRFADGNDYAAAVAVADLFLADAKPLLDWGNGVVKSEKKDDIIKLPAAVLVNRETGGAAEALAAVLREAGVALILGGTTAGRAMISQEFTLKSGQRLRIATSPVKLGDGTALSAQGVKPDIEVVVNADQERAYFEDAYTRLTKANLAAGAGLSATNQLDGTNRPSRRPRATEADLVRARRDGTSLDADSPFVRDTEPEKPLIRDPALARAVDLLKALAVVRQSRP
jgi:C-terminal processing protease CtpA/Prc